jgi:hypothetical protein
VLGQRYMPGRGSGTRVLLERGQSAHSQTANPRSRKPGSRHAATQSPVIFLSLPPGSTTATAQPPSPPSESSCSGSQPNAEELLKHRPNAPRAATRQDEGHTGGVARASGAGGCALEITMDVLKTAVKRERNQRIAASSSGSSSSSSFAAARGRNSTTSCGRFASPWLGPARPSRDLHRVDVSEHNTPHRGRP